MIPLADGVLAGARSLLLLGAHPDDIELGCGATILTLARLRPDLRVRWMVLSGTPDRADEARASARAFLDGFAEPDIVVHDLPDSDFPDAYAPLKRAVRSARDDFEPDVVFTHQRDDLHQDHRLVSELTLNTFRNHTILEYEICKYDGDLGQPNVFVESDHAAVDRKVALLEQHFRSQHGRAWFEAEVFRAMMRIRGVECHAADGYAEAFYGRKLRLL